MRVAPKGLAQHTLGPSGTVAIPRVGGTVAVNPVGLYIPDDWTDWKCYQFFTSANIFGGLGGGECE